MPLYEYQCDSCGHRFEQIQKFSDPPVDKCPKCDGQVRKLVSSPAFQFKGSGWYVTDYAGNGRKAAEKAEQDTATSAAISAASGDKKADKKTKESSPAKKTSDKASTSKAPKGD